jgi:hypothetical protein
MEHSAAEDTRAELSELRREIERVHAEVHELAEQIADLRAAWEALPGWMRWLANRPAPH